LHERSQVRAAQYQAQSSAASIDSSAE
jgi:hypothetical protein